MFGEYGVVNYAVVANRLPLLSVFSDLSPQDFLPNVNISAGDTICTARESCNSSLPKTQ